MIATVGAWNALWNYSANRNESIHTHSGRVLLGYVAFALNSIVFLLIGFEVQLDALALILKPILVAYLAVTIGRAALLYLVTFLLRRTKESVPWSWSAVADLGWPEGSLSMVLALALPRDYPHRELLVTMTFGVVILSIPVQGLSMGTLAQTRTCQLASREKTTNANGDDEQRRRPWLRSTDCLQMARWQRDVVERLRAEYAGAIADAEQRIRDLAPAADALRSEEELRPDDICCSLKRTPSAWRCKGYLGQEAHDLLIPGCRLGCSNWSLIQSKRFCDRDGVAFEKQTACHPLLWVGSCEPCQPVEP